jgi:hypothetical protein
MDNSFYCPEGYFYYSSLVHPGYLVQNTLLAEARIPSFLLRGATNATCATFPQGKAQEVWGAGRA